MTFTDDDLKRLKEAEKLANETPASQALKGELVATREALAYNQFLILSFPSLLSRLECAENLIEIYRHCRISASDILKVADATEAWLRSKGEKV